jgi:hypothetical protein
MATAVTKFPAAGLSRGFFEELKVTIALLIEIGHITTASTIAELSTAIEGELNADDPRS